MLKHIAIKDIDFVRPDIDGTLLEHLMYRSNYTPIVVEIDGGRYKLLDGVMRLTAAELSGCVEIYCYVQDKPRFFRLKNGSQIAYVKYIGDKGYRVLCNGKVETNAVISLARVLDLVSRGQWVELTEEEAKTYVSRYFTVGTNYIRFEKPDKGFLIKKSGEEESWFGNIGWLIISQEWKEITVEEVEKLPRDVLITVEFEYKTKDPETVEKDLKTLQRVDFIKKYCPTSISCDVKVEIGDAYGVLREVK